MKKLLVLGAMQMHIPLLMRAKERGIYTITCDYIPNNIGHQYADEAYYESTTDFNAVLNLAKEKKVDGIMTFNSDPAALTAAYVGEKLSLPNSGYEAVKIMSEKDLFRDFLDQHSFNCPKHGSYLFYEELLSELDQYHFPVMVKPVDSSGSKGVNVVSCKEELEEKFNYALKFSRCKRIIVEEYIESFAPQLHGDGFVKEGKLMFSCLGDHHFNKDINNLVPISTTFPSSHTKENIDAVEQEVARFIQLVGFKQGGINIEARINKEGEIFLIEVGARNGGNFTPLVIQKATNFNFVDAALSVALGDKTPEVVIKETGNYGYLILHSNEEGILKDIILDKRLKDIVVNQYIYIQPGEKVYSFRGANAAVGVLIVYFESHNHKKYILDNFRNLFRIKLA